MKVTVLVAMLCPRGWNVCGGEGGYRLADSSEEQILYFQDRKGEVHDFLFKNTYSRLQHRDLNKFLQTMDMHRLPCTLSETKEVILRPREEGLIVTVLDSLGSITRMLDWTGDVLGLFHACLSHSDTALLLADMVRD